MQVLKSASFLEEYNQVNFQPIAYFHQAIYKRRTTLTFPHEFKYMRLSQQALRTTVSAVIIQRSDSYTSRSFPSKAILTVSSYLNLLTQNGARKSSPVLVSMAIRVLSVKNSNKCYINFKIHFVVIEGYQPWGYHDHVITLVAAKTGARLLIREQGYIFLRHYDTDTSKNCTQ